MRTDLLTWTDARFWAKVDRGTSAECWNWLGAHKAHGYGHLNRSGRWVLAHRYAYELTKEPIPEGLELDHLCRNRRCVNPEHLEPVSRQENLRRAAAQVTHCPQGHAYAETSYVTSTGSRLCRVCHAANERRRRLKAAGQSCSVEGCSRKAEPSGLCTKHRKTRTAEKHGLPNWSYE